MRRTAMTALALALTVAGCAPGPTDSALRGQDQTGDGASVYIDRVVLAGHEQGWVTIHSDDGGQAGVRIGIAPVEAGVTRNLHVPLDVPVARSSVLHAVLHADDHVVGLFEGGDTGGADQPLHDGGRPASRRFELRVP